MARLAGRLKVPSLSWDARLVVTARAIDHWQRLGPGEQERFRELVDRADGNAGANLSRVEYKELRRMWKKLDVATVVRAAARPRTRSPRGAPGER